MTAATVPLCGGEPRDMRYAEKAQDAKQGGLQFGYFNVTVMDQKPPESRE